MTDQELHIAPGTAIPLAAIDLTAARSSGPGGQHVNTTATKVRAEFDVANSEFLSEAQKERIRAKLASRLTNDGRLIVSAGARRSQAANRRAALHRMQELLRQALRVEKKRKATKPSRAAKARRVENKRKRGAIKSTRRTPKLNE
jgi:ribosome-associated protein